MQIRLSIILDELRRFRIEEHFSSDFNPAFSLCLPLPEDVGELEKDCLYVGLLSHALKFDRSESKAVIICLRDRFTDNEDAQDRLNHLVIVNENISSMSLLSAVQERFYSVVRWKERMDAALLSDCSMQDLVDLCPPLLVNHIQITDASFMKLAQTTAFDCDCPICVNLKKYGYHPEESVEKFRKYHLFDVWARLDDKLYYDQATDVSKYPTLHRVFKFHGNYYAHVVMTCANAPVTQGMKDLFQLFIDDLSFCIERDWETQFSCVHPYDNFFLDLLDGKITNKTELYDRAVRIGFPTEGRFYILYLVRAHEQNVPLGTVMKDFSIEFPRFKFINYQNGITAFVHASEKSQKTQNELLKGMERFLEKYNCYCGVSTCFEQLVESHQCFRQARLAMKYGGEMRSKRDSAVRFSEPFESNTRIFSFDLSFPYCFFGGEEDPKELWFSSVYHQQLKKLYQKDLQHGTDDLRLLTTYIRHERRNSEVAASLNMHRNTVIYKIRNIEDYLGIDLNDEHTRNMLIFACLAAEYYGFSA